MKKIVLCSVVLVCLAILAGGCSKGTNIFGWMAPSGGSSSASAASGDAAYASGDYAASMKYYESAVNADPKNSKARYGYVKAYVKSIGLDLAEFLQSYSNQQSPSFVVPGVSEAIVSNAPYNLIDNPTKPFGIDLVKFETLVSLLITYLDPIANGQCDGFVNPNSIGLNINLAFAHLVRGVFYVIDYDYNGSINFNLRHNDDDTIDVVDLNGSTIEGTNIPGKKQALDELDVAIARLDVAIANSAEGTVTGLWKNIRDILIQVKTEIYNHI